MQTWAVPGRAVSSRSWQPLFSSLQAWSLLLLRLSPSLGTMLRSAQEARCWAKYLVQVMSERKEGTSGVYKP